MASKNYIGLARITEVFTLLKNKLHKVAFSGSYNDLSGTENVAVKNANNRFSANQIIDDASGTTSTEGYTGLTLGNNKPSGTDGNTRGILQIFGKGAYSAGLRASNMTANRNIELPDASGTIALKSDFLSIKKTTVTRTTNAYGQLEGSTSSVFGAPDGSILLGIYISNGSFSNWRHVEWDCYGSAGYRLTFKDNGSLIASASITFTSVYVEP